MPRKKCKNYCYWFRWYTERSFFTYNHKVGKHSKITRSSTELECEIAEGEWNKGENFNACSAECRYEYTGEEGYYEEGDDYYSQEEIESCIDKQCYKCEPAK